MGDAFVAVTGSVAYDHIMNFDGKFRDHILADKLHVLNVSFLVQDLQRLRGGCAANIAYAMALHGLTPNLVAAVGKDFDEYKGWLEERGVNTSAVVVHDDLFTAQCFITTDEENNQITGFYPGAMGQASQIQLNSVARDADAPALVTISPNDPAAMRSYPAQCRELGLPFLYDPGQQVIALSAEDLQEGIRGAKVVVTNDYEQSVVSEKTGWDRDAILEHCEALVVTLGGEGCRVYRKDEDTIAIPVAPVKEVLDPTGAGDAFRGGLVKGLLSGADWETSGRLAALTASYCVEVRGTTNYHFDTEAFQTRYAEAFGEPAKV